MGAPTKLLEELELAAPAQADGVYPAAATGDFHVWFRQTFKVEKPTEVSAGLEVSDNAMSPFARFAVVNNDGHASVTHFVAGQAPPKTFEPNEHGYTVMAYSKALSDVPAGRWRLSALADVPLVDWAEMPTSDPATFAGTYAPNYAHLICRFRLAITERSLLAFHFDSDVPAGLKVTMTDPEEGWETKQAEYLRGGHKGHLHGTEVHRWNAYTVLTVPALAFEPMENGLGYVVVEVKLDNARCGFDVQPNGDIPAPLTWKLTCYSSAPDATTWTEDTARADYLESTVEAWNSEDAERQARAEAALAKWEAAKRGGRREAVVKEVREREGDGGEGGGDEERVTITLAPEERRVVRKGGALSDAAYRAMMERPEVLRPKEPPPVVVTEDVYAEREEALKRRIEESKARLQAFVAKREAMKQSRESANRQKSAEFATWRELQKTKRFGEVAGKRAAYLESIKPPPEPEPTAEGEGEGEDVDGGDAIEPGPEEIDVGA